MGKVIETSITKAIQAGLKRALDEKAIVVVAAPAGAGKSAAVAAFAKRNRGTIVVRCHRSFTMPDLLNRIAAARKLDIGLTTRDEAVAKVKAALEKAPGLVVLDDAHNLAKQSADEVFTVLAELWGDHAFGVALCGESPIEEWLGEGQTRPAPAALGKLVAQVVAKGDLTEDDVAALAPGASKEVCAAIRAKAGASTGEALTLWRSALVQAKRGGVKPTPEMVAQAAKDLALERASDAKRPTVTMNARPAAPASNRPAVGIAAGPREWQDIA